MKDKERDLHVKGTYLHMAALGIKYYRDGTYRSYHMEEAKHLIRHVLEDTGIHHVTLEFECEGSTCDKETC